MFSNIWRSIILLGAIFLVALLLLMTALKPYVWVPSGGGMPSRLSGGGAFPRGDCAAMFKSYVGFVKPPLFGKPIDCMTLKGYQTLVFFVQLEEGPVLEHDEIGFAQEALYLSISITILCACALWVIFARTIKSADVSKKQST